MFCIFLRTHLLISDLIDLLFPRKLFYFLAACPPSPYRDSSRDERMGDEYVFRIAETEQSTAGLWATTMIILISQVWPLPCPSLSSYSGLTYQVPNLNSQLLSWLGYAGLWNGSLPSS